MCFLVEEFVKSWFFGDFSPQMQFQNLDMFRRVIYNDLDYTSIEYSFSKFQAIFEL